ncbi:MAG: MFS transporter [Chthonomonadaceae bacterium]|nr:MFS transporter [Chthonomonadaceae bacterium]
MANSHVTSSISRFSRSSLMIAIFCDLVGFGMVIPDIQTRLETFGARGWVIGAILSSYFLVMILVSPLWGRWSDRVGRKPILIICGVFSVASMLAYAGAHSLPAFLLSRILAGFAAANVVVAQAYVADFTEEGEDRTNALGKMGAAITSGLIVGPAIGGWLSARGGNVLLGDVAALISGVGALWIALAVPNASPRAENKPGKKAALRLDFSLVRDLPQLRFLFGFSTLIFFALACLEGTFGRLIRARLGLGPDSFGLIFGYESLLSTAIQVVGVGGMISRVSARFLLCLACVLQSIGIGLIPYAPSLAFLFLLSTVYAIGSGISNPLLNSLCSAATPEPRQGEMFGTLQSVRSLGFLLGPLLGNILFDWHIEAPYLMSATILLFATFWARGGLSATGVPLSKT